LCSVGEFVKASRVECNTGKLIAVEGRKWFCTAGEFVKASRVE